MYTKEEAAVIKEKFWTSFGRYMAPVLSSDGFKQNWINYKTGVPQVFFRMDATKSQASIAIEIRHKDALLAREQYSKFLLLEDSLRNFTGEDWAWHSLFINDFGQSLSKIEKIQRRLIFLGKLIGRASFLF
jgi:hypothetical protein